jgi:hypothetical protein
MALRHRLYAVMHGKHEATDILLQAGADVHATTQSGDTALHWAAYKVDNQAWAHNAVARTHVHGSCRVLCMRSRHAISDDHICI